MAPPPQAGRARRALLFALGWLCFALGAAGLLLPVVPTTPFMLLALWAFSASSPRFHDWLFHHRLFGPPLQRWKRERVVPAWVKAVAWTSMAASLAYVALVRRAPWWLLVPMAAFMAWGFVYVARIPSRPRQPSKPPS